MRERILERLTAIEREHDVRILFACESGSRAWGFASPDSDYDVRFLFVQRSSRYLSVQEPRDGLEFSVEGLLDLSGWDVRKALRLLRKSNAALFEWLQSTIVYREDAVAMAGIRALVASAHSPVASLAHYLGLARGTWTREFTGSEVSLKKYFYVLRPLLAARWSETQPVPAPIALVGLLEQAALADDVRAAITDLLRRKSDAEEKARVVRVPVLDAFVAAELARLAAIRFPPAPAPDPAPFDACLRGLVHGATGPVAGPEAPGNGTTLSSAPTPPEGTTFARQFGDRRVRLLFEAVTGSRAYGTASAGSDTDIRGVFALPRAARVSLLEAPDEIADARQDVKYFELRKFFDLAASANPNLLELLWLPEDCLRYCHPSFARVIERRGWFLSRRVADSFANYAFDQIKRAKGQNKLVHHPQPEAPPAQQDFCWIVPFATAGAAVLPAPPRLPGRPVRLREYGWDLSRYHVAGLEHAPLVYRLYEYGDRARGVFRGGQLVCESIPIEDEGPRFRGFLLYNHPEWEKALREWKRYWEWRERRNPSRWEDQERGERDYDAKNLMHCMRLLTAGLHLLRHGELPVRAEGDARAYLLEVRVGGVGWDAVLAEAQRRMEEIRESRERSPLPEHPDLARLDALFREVAESA